MIRARMTESSGRLKCTIHSSRPKLKGVVRVSSGVPVDDYDGDYIVTPIPYNSQTLETKDKRMLEDVTVLAIPYYETSNTSGLTVYIGGE